jgi:hypothetical protein
MLLPIAIVTTVIYAVRKASKRKSNAGMTATRMRIYQSALVTLKDSEKLRRLAQVFEDEGCVAEARVLRQRAALRDLPKETKTQRRLVFSRAIRSSNVDAVRKVAAAFAGEGAVGAAANLRRHAESLVLEAEMLKVFTEPLTDEPEEVASDEEETSEEQAQDEVAEAVDNTEGQQEIDERESTEEQPSLDPPSAAS